MVPLSQYLGSLWPVMSWSKSRFEESRFFSLLLCTWDTVGDAITSITIMHHKDKRRTRTRPRSSEDFQTKILNYFQALFRGHSGLEVSI